MIITTENHLHDATAHLMTLYQRYTVALLTMKRQNEPWFIGSGFCIEHSKGPLLITAGHVFESMVDGLFVGKSTFASVGATGFRSAREDDDLDLGMLLLEPSFVAENGIQPVPLSLVDRHATRLDGFHYLIGFPGSKNKMGSAVNVGARQIESTCLGINTYRTEESLAPFGKSPATHFAVAYSSAKDRKGMRFTPPSMKGMSGSPVWITRDRIDFTNALLGGILIEYHDPPKIGICTSIAEVLGFANARLA